jgi:hypothetical protein
MGQYSTRATTQCQSFNQRTFHSLLARRRRPGPLPDSSNSPNSSSSDDATRRHHDLHSARDSRHRAENGHAVNRDSSWLVGNELSELDEWGSTQLELLLSVKALTKEHFNRYSRVGGGPVHCPIRQIRQIRHPLTTLPDGTATCTRPSLPSSRYLLPSRARQNSKTRDRLRIARGDRISAQGQSEERVPTPDRTQSSSFAFAA